jgi:hypothetical protein
MVHGTKNKKWITACKGNSFIRRSIRSSLRYARPNGFREPEFASIKKILKPRNQVLSLKLTIEDLQKLQTGWCTTR